MKYDKLQVKINTKIKNAAEVAIALIIKAQIEIKATAWPAMNILIIDFNSAPDKLRAIDNIKKLTNINNYPTIIYLDNQPKRFAIQF